MVNRVSESGFGQDWERRCRDEMAYLQRNIGEMNAIREQWPDDWEIEELARVIIYDESQIIQMLKEEIEHGRKKHEKLG